MLWWRVARVLHMIVEPSQSVLSRSGVEIGQTSCEA